MKRRWRDSILDALQRVAGPDNNVVTRKQLIVRELATITSETASTGATPEQTLSYELQGLRDEGLLQFIGRGTYRLTRPIVEAETFGGAEQELDLAIREGRFRIGRIETSNELALQRRRRGQQRLRQLTLGNYRNMCALCDLKIKPLLVASHIVPWGKSEDARGDLCNLIILCRPHDSLFEYGLWSLDAALKIVRKPVSSHGWVVKALLPEDLSFRRPQFFVPRADYLDVHRLSHGIAVESP